MNNEDPYDPTPEFIVYDPQESWLNRVLIALGIALVLFLVGPVLWLLVKSYWSLWVDILTPGGIL